MVDILAKMEAANSGKSRQFFEDSDDDTCQVPDVELTANLSPSLNSNNIHNIQGNLQIVRGTSPTLDNQIIDDYRDWGIPNPTPCNTSHVTPQMEYSLTKVRIVLPLIIVLNSVMGSSFSLVAQYILDRWTAESHHNKSDFSSVADKDGCDRNGSGLSEMKNDDIQARVSVETMYYSFATGFPALLSCLLFGAIVDIVGRRPAIISSLLGYTIKIILVICIVKFSLDTNLFYLAYAIDGIAGSFYVHLIATFSITADVSGDKNTRILGIAILIVLGTSMSAAASVVVGILIKHVGYVAASSAILGPVALSLIVALFFLPETLPMQRQKLSVKKLWDYTTRIVFLYSRDGDRRKRLSLFISLLIFFTSVLNTINVGTNDTLYQRHAPLCWDSAQIGYYAAVRFSGAYIVALIYLCICRCIGCASDEVLSMVGLLFGAGSFVMEAFVRNSWQMYMVPILVVPSLNTAPITRGVMSILAGPDKQGVMFSSIALIEVMCSLVANIVYNKIYAVTVDFLPGFVYLVMAGVSIVTFLIYIPFFHFYDGPPDGYEIVSQTDGKNDGSSPVHSSTPSSRGGAS